MEREESETKERGGPPTIYYLSTVIRLSMEKREEKRCTITQRHKRIIVVRERGQVRDRWEEGLSWEVMQDAG